MFQNKIFINSMLYQAKLKEDKGLVKIFECIISGFEVGKQTEAELNKLKESAHLKGFRKGKAPMSVIQDAYFGKVYFDIVNKEANKCIFEIAEENKFNLASSPKIELDAESSLPADRNTANIRDITITITYETFPEIPAFDFAKISLEKVSANITDADLSEELSKLAKNMATTQPKTDGAIEKGDVAIIDFAGFESGVAFQGGTASDYRLEIGSKSFIEGFEEGLVGAKIGEERSLMLQFPEEYHAENLAGKPVEFKTTIKEIHKSVPAELNDELAKKYGFDTLDLLKEDMKKSISANYENAYKARQKDTVFNQIKEHLNFEVPASVLERVTVDGQVADSSIKDARLSVFLMQYAKEKSISVTQEDFSMYVESIARMYGQSAKSLLGFYEKNEQMRESTMNSIFENKIFEALYDAVPVAAKSVSKAEIEEILKPEPHVHTEDCDHSAQ